MTDNTDPRQAMTDALAELARVAHLIENAVLNLPALTDQDRAEHAGCEFRVTTDVLSQSTRYVLDRNEAHPDMQDVDTQGAEYLLDLNHGLTFALPDDTEWM